MLYESPMKEEIKNHLDLLARRPFNKAERIIPLLETLGEWKPATEVDAKCLRTLARWLVVPYTLWPVDFAGICKRLRSGKNRKVIVPKDLRLLLSMVEQVPEDVVQELVAEFEGKVKAGIYELLIDSKTKVEGRERDLSVSDSFRSDWQKVKAGVDLEGVDGRNKVKRRSMVQERNFKPHFPYETHNTAKRNQAIFDAFCYRWNLYGMEDEKPLPLKPSVNITPHGTMIFIPSQISLDRGRDVHWKEIKRLHEIWHPRRQGKVFSVAKHERREKALKAFELWNSKEGKSLASKARYRWVKKQLGYVDEADDSTIRRLVSEGKRFSTIR